MSCICTVSRLPPPPPNPVTQVTGMLRLFKVTGNLKDDRDIWRGMDRLTKVSSIYAGAAGSSHAAPQTGGWCEQLGFWVFTLSNHSGQMVTHCWFRGSGHPLAIHGRWSPVFTP
ncbi:hypothetical protein FKM82_017211 [Ascaphus truei]